MPTPPRNLQPRSQSLGPKDAKTNTVGNIFYGSNGYLAIDGYDAYKTWITDQVEPGPHGKASGDHYANFIECVRSRRAEDIHSPILEAHISTTLVHLANASYRLGRTLKFDPATEQVIADDEANTLLRGTYRAPVRRGRRHVIQPRLRLLCSPAVVRSLNFCIGGFYSADSPRTRLHSLKQRTRIFRCFLHQKSHLRMRSLQLHR